MFSTNPLQRDRLACSVQLFPAVLLDTKNISSGCYMHFLEEVKETEEIRSNIPAYNSSDESCLTKIFPAIKHYPPLYRAKNGSDFEAAGHLLASL